MKGKGMSLAAAAVLVFAAGCATTYQGGKTGDLTGRRPAIADLDRALEQEKDEERISALLFERGHAYLTDAEQLRASRRASEGMNSGGVEYATLILGAIRDFESVVRDFPDGPEAPEALFHLGIVYDYPNLSKFGIALNYYRQVVEKYTGTEAALKAEGAIRKIEDNVRAVIGGEHGESI